MNRVLRERFLVSLHSWCSPNVEYQLVVDYCYSYCSPDSSLNWSPQPPPLRLQSVPSSRHFQMHSTKRHLLRSWINDCAAGNWDKRRNCPISSGRPLSWNVPCIRTFLIELCTCLGRSGRRRRRRRIRVKNMIMVK